jgi:hypothetical protein
VHNLGVIDLETTFDWSQIRLYPELQVIYHTLAQFALQQYGVESIDVSHVSVFTLHPLPHGCSADCAADEWAEEVGRLLTVHKDCCTGVPFIGVGCTSAFAGGALTTYDNPDSLPCFPLIGPNQVGALADYMVWDVPDDSRCVEVTFADAKSKIRLLGGKFNKAKGSSHSQVQFVGGRTWPLDSNYDVIPEDYLRELEDITGYKLPVIKYVLTRGKWPPRVKRALAHN